MRAALLNLLACPHCLGELELHVTSTANDKIDEGSLGCRDCRAEYPVLGGIPRFVPDPAYARSFSFEWRQWRRTQFDTAARNDSLATFTASTGYSPADLAGKTVLEAGCGAGRYMDLLARAGAQVIGIDMSQAIEVAQENLGHLPNCHFVQGDLMRPPFRMRAFDFVYSIGVLHHTPSTRKAFSGLVPLLKDGGEISVWVYPLRRLSETFRRFPDRVNQVLSVDSNFTIPTSRQATVKRFAGTIDWLMEASNRFQRAFTTRLPARLLFVLCHAAIPLYYLYRLPLFYPLRLVTKIAMHPDPEWRVLDTFDWYSPRYQWKHTFSELEEWFREAGLTQITIMPRPVAVRGRRPDIP
ncbi:MAG: methyltransferase domain-containing protein [Acidobacteria bacterium]|nr:MAG: methyltransferase domain-containing protein [Acidobacteriota bacterium]